MNRTLTSAQLRRNRSDGIMKLYIKKGDDIMPMNLVIQERRKELGFTQEQVAEYLGVSIPAVSKWESGLTSPDLSLLPPLARFLKTDLNTLFCFQADISQQEIGYFCREAAAIVQAKGMAAGFEAAEQKIHEYPHNETLLHCLVLQLDGLLTMSELSDEQRKPYDDKIVGWYEQLAKSGDGRISNSADFMLAGRCIRGGDYDKAQEILDRMPDKEDVLSSMADKRMMQVNLFLQQGKTVEAVRMLQNSLLQTLNKAQLLLWKLIDAELLAGKTQTARSIADKAGRIAELSDFTEYHSLIPHLSIATAEQNADECIRILRDMLASMMKPWDRSSSPLFDQIAGTSDLKQMLPAVLSEMEQNSAYGFLQGREELAELISTYKEMVGE